jgi:hypothetical protein
MDKMQTARRTCARKLEEFRKKLAIRGNSRHSLVLAKLVGCRSCSASQGVQNALGVADPLRGYPGHLAANGRFSEADAKVSGR